VWNRGVKPVVTPSTGVLASIAVETPNKLFGDSGGRTIPSEPDGSAIGMIEQIEGICPQLQFYGSNNVEDAPDR